jgi:hypothetical protein
MQHELEIRISRDSRDELMADYEAVSRFLEGRHAMKPTKAKHAEKAK